MHYFFSVILCLLGYVAAFGQVVCGTEEAQVIVDLQFDAYPGETGWTVVGPDGTLYGQSTPYDQSAETASDTICVPAAACLRVEILDQFGDGMCCAYGSGSYTIRFAGEVVATGGAFTDKAVHTFNCPPGSTCESAIPVAADTSWTTADHAWYRLEPANSGNYLLSTCTYANSCPTDIWIYEYCANLGADSTNLGTVFYNSGACGNQSQIVAGLDTTKVYYLRVGSAPDCTQDSVSWTLQYEGPITGCIDPGACNYNPLATVSDGSCSYPGDPACPDGPDLVIDQAAFVNSLYLSTLNNGDNCMIQEGCLSGYGPRDLLRFDTRIRNVGNQDYYIGQPPVSVDIPDPAWEWDLCHGHWHYEGYAEYVVYDLDGNELPLGFKNGFCVMDIECADGGTAKYSCSNQGITAGCGDIYDAQLPCQWFDITELPAGTYTFVVRTNWNKLPDALGRHELDYSNNWAQVCLDITRDPITNAPSFAIADACDLFVDCAGDIQGNAVPDCAGECGGSRLAGDLNVDALRDQADIFAYFDQVLEPTEALTTCNDLDADGAWTAVDLALFIECSIHEGQPTLPGHAHSPCEFPFSIINPADTVRYEILEVNPAEGYADIGIHPQTVSLSALQLEFSGIHIEGVTNSVDFYNAEMRADHNTVVAASLTEDLLEKSTGIQPLCRIYFTPVDSIKLCLEAAVSVNAVRERTVSLPGACRSATTVATTGPGAITSSLRVYPNPTDTRARVVFDNPAGALLTLTLLDAAGREQVRARTRGGSWSVDTGALPNGVYWVRVAGDRTTDGGRLVVAH